MGLARREEAGGKSGASPFPAAFHPQADPRVGGRLHRPGVRQPHPFHRHVLMAGEQQVEVKFPGDAAGHVLAAVRQQAPGGQLFLEAAVVDAHAHIAQRAQRLPGGAGRLKGVGDAQLLQVPGLLPHVHKIGDDAGDAHPAGRWPGCAQPMA